VSADHPVSATRHASDFRGVHDLDDEPAFGTSPLSIDAIRNVRDARAISFDD
jgi:hypothetical protein